MAFSAQSLPLSHKRAVQKNKTVKLNPNISRIKNSAFFRIWGFAPSPHQRAFRFRLFVSATGSNNRKPLWKPSGKNS